MATSKTKSTEIKESLAKKIWLAGLGAYGHSLDQVQSQYEKFNEDSHKFFDDLVAKGESVQNDASSKVKGKVKESNQKLEARIEELRERLSLTHNLDKRLADVNAKLDKLSRRLSRKS